MNKYRLLAKLIPEPSFLPVAVVLVVARHPDLRFDGVMLQ